MKAATALQRSLLMDPAERPAIGTWTMRPEVHDAMAYPHPAGCERCYGARRCNSCGASTRQDSGRCTNGRCTTCHRAHCAPGGETSPGHGYGPRGTTVLGEGWR